MHIKIADFGSAKILTEDDAGLELPNISRKYNCNFIYWLDRRSSFDGTAQYVSPEVLESKPVSHATDLWALGCVIYQLISGLPPFNDQYVYINIWK